mgnify:CR=1 FL=1
MRTRGFTLVELIVVIAIIAILAAVVAPNAFKAIEKAKISKALSDFKAIKSASYALYGDTGRWPEGGNSAMNVVDSRLMRNNGNIAKWDGPYLENFKGMHPWGGTYRFTTNAGFQKPSTTLTIYPLCVEFEDTKFPSGPNEACPVPFSAARKIDSAVDDGVLYTGEFKGDPNWPDYHWVLIWDFCGTTAQCIDPL